MDDLWLQLKRQTEDMENHIRRLASCDNQDTSAGQEMSLESPQMGRMDIDEDLPISVWAGRSRMRVVSDGSLAQAAAMPGRV